MKRMTRKAAKQEANRTPGDQKVRRNKVNNRGESNLLRGANKNRQSTVSLSDPQSIQDKDNASPILNSLSLVSR